MSAERGEALPMRTLIVRNLPFFELVSPELTLISSFFSLYPLDRYPGKILVHFCFFLIGHSYSL